MPVLKNIRQERFAQFIAQGRPLTTAYGDAGYRPHESHASRLGAKGIIKARIQELTELGAGRVEVTKARIIAELARIAFSDMKEFATWNESGATWKSNDELTSEQTRCISSIKQTMNEYGGTTELKLYDKQRALELLGKELGMFVDRSKHEVTGRDGSPLMQPIHVMVANMGMPELIERAREVLNALPAGSKRGT